VPEGHAALSAKEDYGRGFQFGSAGTRRSIIRGVTELPERGGVSRARLSSRSSIASLSAQPLNNYKRCMLIFTKPEPDFSWGFAGRRIGHSLSATHPYRNSRIGSGRHALAALLVQVCEGPQKGSSEKILQGTSGYRPAAGHDNSSKCFIVIFGYAPISWPAFKDCASPRAQPRDVRNLSPSGRLPLPGCTLRGPQRAYLD
jgi:hypothetical protein